MDQPFPEAATSCATATTGHPLPVDKRRNHSSQRTRGHNSCTQAHAKEAPFACHLLVHMRNYTPLPVRTLSRRRRRRRNTTPGQPGGHAASAVGETTFPRSFRTAAAEPIRFGIAGVGTSRPAAEHGFLGRIRRSPVGSRQVSPHGDPSPNLEIRAVSGAGVSSLVTTGLANGLRFDGALLATRLRPGPDRGSEAQRG